MTLYISSIYKMKMLSLQTRQTPKCPCIYSVIGIKSRIMRKKIKMLGMMIITITILIAMFAIKRIMHVSDLTSMPYNECANASVYYDSVVDLRIIAIVGVRSKSLGRLLNSLNTASYFNDNVVLDIWIDLSVDGKFNLETYEVASSFQFRHGKKYIHIHSSNVGVFGQWINTWNVSANSSEIGVILEDDIEVSPFYYQWLKLVHLKYDSYANINGYSLHGTCENHGLLGKKSVEIPKYNTVFLYPAFNTWGFSPNIRHWVHFVNWVKIQAKNKSFTPFVPNIAPTFWYKEAILTGKEANNWDMWHVYHAYVNKEFTMFPNFPGDRGLAIHWKEKGLHYEENKSKKPSGDLLFDCIPNIEWLPDHPVYLDYTGKEINYTNFEWF